MDATHRVDEFRRDSSEVENHLIDALSAGRISRKEFVRRGTVLGLSLSGALLHRVRLRRRRRRRIGDRRNRRDGGAGKPRRDAPHRHHRAGDRAQPAPGPRRGRAGVLGQSGEYLAWSNDQLELEPRLAESWEPNEDGSVWTFKIRQGVTFHDGAPLTAEDVVYTLNLNADPKNKGNALSAFGDPAASRREVRRRSTTPRSWSRSTARTAASPTSSPRTTTTSSSSPTTSIRRRGRSRSWERARGFSTRSRRSRA